MFVLLTSAAACLLIRPQEEKSFLIHMRKHGIIYTGDEYHFRLGIYLTTSRRAREFNRGVHSFTIGMGPLSTLTASEYRWLLGSIPKPDRRRGLIESGSVAVTTPDSFDWRDKGVVQVVKDQGQCGSGWAFGAIGAQESGWAITSSTLWNLSEQNLIDCATTCSGCDGGSAAQAFAYVLAAQGGAFCSAASYPYTGVQQTCAFATADNATSMIGYKHPESPTEDALAACIFNYAPYACAIDASHTSFQLYSSGIYDEPDCSSTNVDHGVLCVGFAVDYWIVKNSWGTAWGEKGYIRMVRGKDNQCGIASQPYRPVNQ
jgi:cathepsin L